METNKIDLNIYLDESENALIGREEGKKFLKKLESKGINIESGEKVVIIVPDRIITMNNSFFQGFLGAIVRDIGVERFLKKYEFETSEHIQKHIPKYACATMFEATTDTVL